LLEQLEGGACSNGDLRCWVKAAAEELKMLRDGACTPTELDCDLMYTIGVEYEEFGVTGNGPFAEHACVI